MSPEGARWRWPAAAVALLAGAGCASGPSYLDGARAEAIRTAELRNLQEQGCDGSRGEVTYSETLLGPPPQSVAYKVVVSGCGQKKMFVVQCTAGRGCYTGAGQPVR